MIARLARFSTFLILVFAAACGSLPSLPLPPQPGSVSATPSFTAAPTITASATPAERVLRVWLPPEFDPNADMPASVLLKARLTEFAQAHPALTFDVRVKKTEDDMSLLDVLSLTYEAAPDALPDLVALQRSDLEDAALKGYLHPLDGLTELLNSPDWYPYARQLGHVQNAMYGLPFAGDALALAYHPSQFQTPPVIWQDILAKQHPLALSTSDPNGTFALSLYLSTGSRLTDDLNNPFLDETVLTNVLQQVSALSIAPVDSEDAAWRAFTDHRVDLALVWVSHFLQDPQPDSAILPLPGLEQAPFTLTTSWNWALAGSDTENQILAAELAEWLMDDNFLSEWAEAAGYLPTRPQALTQWANPVTFDAISQSAQAMPADSQLTKVGPAFQNALNRILHDDQAAVVAQDAVDALK